MSEFQILLAEIDLIRKKYQTLQRNSGEKFNLFKILDLSTREVRTHSAFIVELLNPEGSHEKGDLFLSEFINTINNYSFRGQQPITFEVSDKVIVNKEFHTGYITDTEGGNIDILLTDDHKNQIIIENKINAGDEERQLLRYHSFNPNAPLLYLTLDKHPPSDWSTGKVASVLEKVICISYKEEIITWLENSLPKVSDHPILRESLRQYIVLIKNLTKQGMKENERNEIVKLVLENRDLFDTLKYIDDYSVFREVRIKAMEFLFQEITEDHGIAKRFNLKVDYKQDRSRFGLKGFDFWFYRDGWKFCIYFWFNSDFGDIWYGIDNLDEGSERNENDRKKFRELLGDSYTEGGNWIWNARLDKFDDVSPFEMKTEGKKVIMDVLDEILQNSEKYITLIS